MSERGFHEPTPERIVAIIRRDLMLGPEVELTPETPLYDSDLDLDSLDALLLMQSMEKEFGFKVPTAMFGPQVFKNVATLTQFVQQQKAAAASA